MDKSIAIKYLEKKQKQAYLRIGTDPEELSKIRRKLFFENLATELKLREKTLDDKELQQYRELRIKDFESALKLPLLTKYEDPVFHFLIDDYVNSIEEGTKIWQLPSGKLQSCIAEFSSKKSDLILGVMPIGKVNAMSIAVPTSNDFLIVFESELFTYCLLMSKVISLCMIDDDSNTGSFDMNINKIMKKIDTDKQILKRFQELLFAYLIKGTPGLAPRYIIEPRYEQVVKNLLNSMEIFILGHEYAHILLGHLGTKSKAAFLADTEWILYEQNQELEADFVGLFLSLGAMKVRGYDFSLGYWGVELFFSCDEIIQKGLCILRTGTDDWYWKGGKEDGPLGTHPPANVRRDMLRKLMRDTFGDQPAMLGELVEKILTRLWEKTRPELIRLYTDKVEPNTRWQ